jgi:asparagine synthase (glutamine-hydrolysing)
MAEANGVIRLPRWYAGFRGRRGTAAPDDQSAERVGPFEIDDPAHDLASATFGRGEDPGVVLFEGYLFERPALKRELGLDANVSDARVAAAAFERWGGETFDRIDGSYLLAIWDPVQQRLLLGHDALGHHPAYYATAGDTLWFSSNVLALAASGRVPRDPNRVSLALAALMRWPAPGQTFFEGVNRVRAGSYLEVNPDGSLREHRYFSPWPDDGEPDLTEAECHEQLEPTLIGAVERRMALAPSGIMLSGGLDSVTIAALATDFTAAHGLPPITAVSGRQDGDHDIEAPFQDATAGALGLPQVAARESEWIRGRNIVDLSLEAIPELPAPSRTYWVGGYMAFYRFTAERNVNVLLTGSGGDNWVSVGNAYAADCLRRVELSRLARFVRSYTGTGGLSLRRALEILVWSGGFRVLLDSFSARYVPRSKARYHRWRSRQALPDWICPDPKLREALADTVLAQRPPSLSHEGRVPSNYLRHEQRSVVNPYYQYEFEIGFHIESTCGLRLLSPYHDRRLIRFLNRVPAEVLLLGSKYKGLLRLIAERRLPGLGLKTQQKVYSASVRDSILDNLRVGTARVWSPDACERLSKLGVVEAEKLRSRFEAPAERGLNDLITMSALLSANRWAGNHVSS